MGGTTLIAHNHRISPTASQSVFREQSIVHHGCFLLTFISLVCSLHCLHVSLSSPFHNIPHSLCSWHSSFTLSSHLEKKHVCHSVFIRLVSTNSSRQRHQNVCIKPSPMHHTLHSFPQTTLPLSITDRRRVSWPRFRKLSLQRRRMET